MKEIKNQFVEQKFDSELKAVYAKFHKYVPFAEFLPIFENSFVLIRYHKAEKTLINIKLLSVHDAKSTEYINNVWFPTVKKAGIRYIAFVLPDSAVGKMSSKNAHKSAENIDGLIVNNFSEESDARKWLKSMN